MNEEPDVISSSSSCDTFYHEPNNLFCRNWMDVNFNFQGNLNEFLKKSLKNIVITVLANEIACKILLI